MLSQFPIGVWGRGVTVERANATKEIQKTKKVDERERRREGRKGASDASGRITAIFYTKTKTDTSASDK